MRMLKEETGRMAGWMRQAVLACVVCVLGLAGNAALAQGMKLGPKGAKQPAAQPAAPVKQKIQEQAAMSPEEMQKMQQLFVEKRYVEAMPLIDRGVAQKVPEAQYAKGFLYEFGEGGIKRNYYQARTLYLWASGKDYTPATYRIGVMYEEGKGVRPNVTGAMNWYRKAAAMGNEDAKAKLDAVKADEEKRLMAARAADEARLAEKAAKAEKKAGAKSPSQSEPAWKAE